MIYLQSVVETSVVLHINKTPQTCQLILTLIVGPQYEDLDIGMNPFHFQYLISNSLYCLLYNSHNLNLENLVLDQLVTPSLIFSFILITCLHDLTNRGAMTMLCFVVKHAGSSLSMKEMQGVTQDVVKCFFPLVKCSSCFLHALQQNRGQSWLLYLLNQGDK